MTLKVRYHLSKLLPQNLARIESVLIRVYFFTKKKKLDLKQLMAALGKLKGSLQTAISTKKDSSSSKSERIKTETLSDKDEVSSSSI